MLIGWLDASRHTRMDEQRKRRWKPWAEMLSGDALKGRVEQYDPVGDQPLVCGIKWSHV